MSRIFKKIKNIKLPKERNEKEEFGKSHKGVGFCAKCHSFKYKKSWHNNAEAFLGKWRSKSLPLEFMTCPACNMIKNNLYEGKITIKNLPKKFEVEIVNLIKNSAKQASSKDPMDRLISIKVQKGDMIVTVTENQLASKMARKIKRAFDDVSVNVKYTGKEDDIVLIDIIF